MVRVCSRETLLAEASVVIGGQSVKFERALLRNSVDGTISLIFQLSQESIHALEMESVKMTKFSTTATQVPDEKLHAAAQRQLQPTETQPLVAKPQGPARDAAVPAGRAQVEKPSNETRKFTWISMCDALAAWKF